MALQFLHRLLLTNIFEDHPITLSIWRTWMLFSTPFWTKMVLVTKMWCSHMVQIWDPMLGLITDLQAPQLTFLAAALSQAWALTFVYLFFPITLYNHQISHTTNSTSFRPVPTSRRSLTLGHDSSTGHSLLGACPLDPLVHIFNPSSGTHASSQCWCASFIWIIEVTHIPAPMLWHSLHSAMSPVSVTACQVGVHTASIFDGSVGAH